MTLFTRIEDHHKSPIHEVHGLSDLEHLYNNPNNDEHFLWSHR